MSKITFTYTDKNQDMVDSLSNEFSLQGWEVETNNSDIGDSISIMIDDRFSICIVGGLAKITNELKSFDLVLSSDYEFVIQANLNGINVDWLPHFIDTKKNYSTDNIDAEYTAVSNYEKGYSNFIDSLVEHSQGMIVSKHITDHTDRMEFLNSGLICIENSKDGNITPFIFEAMACGKLVITDRLKESRLLNKLFTEGKDIVLYDDIVDCINKINFFVEHDEERETIAQAGMKRVLENHTQKQRVDFIIEKYESKVNHI